MRHEDVQKLIDNPEIIFAVFAAVLAKVKSSKTLGILGALSTITIGMLSGLFLYEPVRNVMGLDPTNDILVAVITALLFESVAKGILDLSNEPGGFKRVLTAILTRDPDMLKKPDDNRE